ncbi:uncharacterized protein MELLADRAFT_95937 [Melampsora larici-populina 98AG31]|uniref:Uncharacterized protein n=1 Tax=Melampsora larici-populina (strain 98AG31 / pathotype 3-4-7) TaxID=747676 RepID=F4RDT7_MELLP|nr:uncharacterized protein MELLADRAFT_95937 [Melampsora larici-populina 98AG31]EGG09459.1 hypothetical protein MELLADRAFT_95937 [Melampsora larici-populina 98AG31]
MTYQLPYQLPTTTFPLSTPNTQTLPPALLQALHRLATFSSNIQLLTSQFAPHLHFHAHHSCFSKPTPQHFARRRKPTTRSTAWRLQNLTPPDPITHLPASGVTPSASIATLITNAPLRPVSAPPFDSTRHTSKMPRSSSIPPCTTQSRTQAGPNKLVQYALSNHQSDEPLSQNSIKSRSMTSASTAVDLIRVECPIDQQPVLNSRPKRAAQQPFPPADSHNIKNTRDLLIDLNAIISNDSRLPVSASETEVLSASISLTAIDIPNAAIDLLVPTTVGPAPAILTVGPAPDTTVDSSAITTPIDLTLAPFVNESTDDVGLGRTIHDGSKRGDDFTTTDDVAAALLIPATAENLEHTAVVSPPRVPSNLASATKIDPILNAIELAIVPNVNPVIEDLILSAANDHALYSAVGCLTTGDINQDTITDIDQNRTVDLVLNVEKGLADDVDQELDTTKIVALNDQLRLPVASLMKSVPMFAVDRSVDLGDTKAGNHGHAADVHPDPDATTDPVLDDLVSIQSETNHPLQVFISDIHLGSNLDMLSSPQPYHIAHPVASSTDIPSPLMNKKKKKKKNKKKRHSTDNNSSEQHCRKYDVTDNFGFYAPNGWIEDHHHSSNHSPSLQQDMHTPSETNYDHLLGLVHQLLFCHHMYDLLQVDEQGILFGKEYGQHIQNQDVICYSHEGEFMFRRTKDGKIFDYLDVLDVMARGLPSVCTRLRHSRPSPALYITCLAPAPGSFHILVRGWIPDAELAL